MCLVISCEVCKKALVEKVTKSHKLFISICTECLRGETFKKIKSVIKSVPISEAFEILDKEDEEKNRDWDKGAN